MASRNDGVFGFGILGRRKEESQGKTKVEKIRVDVIRPDSSSEETINVLEGAVDLIRANQHLHRRYYLSLKVEGK